MKPLITTQLIEEYQKELDATNEKIEKTSDRETRNSLAVRKDICQRIITSLQSKQSEERQNIVDAYSIALTSFSGMEQTANKEAEDYFNQTFKQEQK